jgi:hypothetical protein
MAAKEPNGKSPMDEVKKMFDEFIKDIKNEITEIKKKIKDLENNKGKK